MNIPTHITYSRVVSLDTVHIGFIMASMNRLDILAEDILNSFLATLTQDKVLFMLAMNVKRIRIEFS